MTDQQKPTPEQEQKIAATVALTGKHEPRRVPWENLDDDVREALTGLVQLHQLASGLSSEQWLHMGEVRAWRQDFGNGDEGYIVVHGVRPLVAIDRAQLLREPSSPSSRTTGGYL